MLKKFISIFIVISLFMIQIHTVSHAEPDFINIQSSIPTVTGNGILIEAENCSYTNWYQLVTDSSASGGKALKAVQAYKTGQGSSRRGELEVTFAAQKAGVYIAWVRAYATGGSQDSYYAGFSGQGYSYIGIEEYNSYIWVKSGNITLTAGEQTTFRAYPRESGHKIDAVIITPTSFVPTGITGNIPEGDYGNTITSKYAPTPYQPPSEHPRVLFRSSDIPRIRANLQKPQNIPALNKINELKSSVTDGNAGGTYNERMLREIEAAAFDYAINANTVSGNAAVSAIMNYLDTVIPSAGGGNETRNGGNVMYMASEVYDWCYDLMTDEQRNSIIETCESYAHNMEIKWPPDSQGSIVGHGSEAQLLRDMLAFAIAVYDERPDIWEAVGGRFYEEYTEARNFYNRGHFALQGDSYGLYRHRWDTYSYLLITGMGLPAPYNAGDMASVGYSQIYLRRPDGQYMRDGDSADDTTYGMWKLWAGYAQTYIVDSSIISDPYLKDEAYAMTPNGEAFYYSSPIIFAVANDPDLEKASVSNLPKSRFFDDPAGVMVARTGWDRGADTNDVVCEMKIGGVRQNNHQHYDAGHFQIYYKGILASDSGVYQGMYSGNDSGGTGYNSEHRNQYMIKTIAHNSMLIYDPSESTGTGAVSDIADGGQRAVSNGNEPSKISSVLDNLSEYRVADVLAHEIDPKNLIDPEYTYIKGNLKKAYTSKVSDFKRSFMFLNLFEEEVPAALVVYDRVTSSSRSFKKTWILHGVEEPTVNGTQTVFSRTYKSNATPSGYNGKMTVDTLLPKANDANIEIVGGEDGFSVVNGTDYTGIPSSSPVDEGNTYRMELSPKSQNTTDHFLNVIQVSDNDKNYYANTEIIESNLFYGAKIRNRAVLFSKSGTVVSSSFTLTAENLCKFTVCDAKAGTWQVVSDEGTQNVAVSEEGGVLAFEASGNVTCSYLSSSGAPVYNEAVLGRANECLMKIDGRYVNGSEKPELENGIFMAPLSTLCEWFDINMAKEGGTVILKRGDSTAHINVGEAVIGMDGAYYNLSAAPYIKNGEVMVPARNIVELYGGSIEWYPLSNIAAIERPPADCSLPEGYAVMKSVTPDSGSVDGGNVAENAIDFDIDTIWAAKGIGRYIDIELEKRQEIDRVEILFNPNSGRNAEFEVFVSDDGVNYRSILESTSNGALEEVAWEIYPLSEPVMAKYVRYMGNGSNISQWNAIKEIRFRLWDDGDDDPSPLENIQVLYSATGSDYANIPDMKDTKTEYTVILPDNSKYAYLRFAVPAGQTAPNTVRYSWNVDCARDWFGENGEDLLGTAEGSGTIDTHVKYQTYVPMEVVAENGIYKVPIKNEFSTVYFSYTDENGTGRDYELNFHAKQPRLTSFTNVLSDRYNSMDEARVVFVSGAAVNNDNGTIVHSGIKESDKIKVMANISEELIGASMFMLPIRSGGASSLFTFTADHGGKIYVLSDEQISGSGYSGWTRENNGTLPTGMQTGTSITVPRDYNSFEGIYALSINWKADRRSSDYGSGTKNYYRAVSPAVSGNLTSTHLTGSYGMKYAYSRTFNAGETVTVPGLGNTSPDSAVIIKWTGDEITEDVSYSVNKKGKITVKASGFTEGNKLISAFYDEAGRLTDCDLMDYSDGVTELEMNPNLYAIANRMKMFIWNTETLEGYFMKEQSMSGIIQ